jgi:CubicO group peptidase (beta-lactamase class C family)
MIRVFFVLASLMFGIPCYAQGVLPTSEPEQAGMSATKLGEIENAIKKRIEEKRVPGVVVMIARNGKVIFFEEYGDRDMSGSKRMEKDTIFRLYSMSKAITSAAAMMLVDEGKISLDEPASTYVPALAKVKVQTEQGRVAPARAITVRDLMRHTSGFPYFTDPAVVKVRQQAKNLEDFVEGLATKVSLAAHPGEKWIYGNSIDVLGLIVQKIADQPIAEFLDARLFKPLGMVDTAFYVPETKRDRFATIYYRPPGQPTIELQDISEDPKYTAHFYQLPKVLLPGTGLVGTAEDYMRFMLMIANGGEWNGRPYLSAEAIRLMTTNQLPKEARTMYLYPGEPEIKMNGVGFGLGFSVCTNEDSWAKHAHVDEFSWGGAANTNAWASPRDNNLIVVTMEQVFMANRETREALRPIIYNAIK